MQEPSPARPWVLSRAPPPRSPVRHLWAPEAQGCGCPCVWGPGPQRRLDCGRRHRGFRGAWRFAGGFLTEAWTLVSGLQVRPRAASGAPAVLRGGHGGPERLREHGPAHLRPLQPGQRAHYPRPPLPAPAVCTRGCCPPGALRGGVWLSTGAGAEPHRRAPNNTPVVSPACCLEVPGPGAGRCGSERERLLPGCTRRLLCPPVVGRGQCPLASPPTRALSPRDPGGEPSTPPGRPFPRSLTPGVRASRRNLGTRLQPPARCKFTCFLRMVTPLQKRESRGAGK